MEGSGKPQQTKTEDLKHRATPRSSKKFTIAENAIAPHQDHTIRYVAQCFRVDCTDHRQSNMLRSSMCIKPMIEARQCASSTHNLTSHMGGYFVVMQYQAQNICVCRDTNTACNLHFEQHTCSEGPCEVCNVKNYRANNRLLTINSQAAKPPGAHKLILIPSLVT